MRHVMVFGLGRIGLPIALVSADCGFNVIGVDKNDSLISKLKKGKTPFNEPMLEDLLQKHLGTLFHPHSLEEDIEDVLRDIEIILVTIGVDAFVYPDYFDLTNLYSMVEFMINYNVIKGRTIILRTTVPIGTTRKIKEYIEERTSYREGKDFFLAFVPERLVEGKAIVEERQLPKIIGAFGDEGFKRASAYFGRIGGKIRRASSPEVAEFVKLIDNAWRHTLFAFSNDIALCAELLGVNVIEAIDAANFDYPRNSVPIPGPVSGYCLSKDPYILEFSFNPIAKKRGFNSIWYYAIKSSEWLIDYIVQKIWGKSVLVAGLSYKENIDDYRKSHGIELTKKLVEKGYSVTVTDPYLNMNEYTRIPEDLRGRVTEYSDIKRCLMENSFDTIVICVKHSEYSNLSEYLGNKAYIIDLWNILHHLQDKHYYTGLGRGDLECRKS